MWLLIMAAYASDFVESGFALVYVDDPTRAFSHSLPSSLAAGLLIGVAWRISGGRWTDAGILIAVAGSHTALDLVTGVKEWWPGVAAVGLDLYSRPLLNGMVESLVCVAGWLHWRKSIAGERRNGVFDWGMLATLLSAQGAAVIYALWFKLSIDLTGLSKFIR